MQEGGDRSRALMGPFLAGEARFEALKADLEAQGLEARVLTRGEFEEEGAFHRECEAAMEDLVNRAFAGTVEGLVDDSMESYDWLVVLREGGGRVVAGAALGARFGCELWGFKSKYEVAESTERWRLLFRAVEALVCTLALGDLLAQDYLRAHESADLKCLVEVDDDKVADCLRGLAFEHDGRRTEDGFEVDVYRKKIPLLKRRDGVPAA